LNHLQKNFQWSMPLN